MNLYSELATLYENTADKLRKAARQQFAPTSRTDDYETTRQKKVVEYFVKNIKSKVVSLDTIRAWTEKSENYILSKLPKRNPKRTKTFYAVDVVKFYCEEYGLDLPEEYFKQCEKFGIRA